jgi:Tol biopolymer transport system component
MVSGLVEDEGSFAWSPDGLRLAYIEMDRSLGEANLVVYKVDKGDRVVIASLPIPKGSGSSIPSSANLSWSSDGKSLVFDLGRGASDRAVYLTHADGTGLVKVADSAYAPSISSDGKCLAYISDKKVFLLDLTRVASTSTSTDPLLLADLPSGRSIADYRLDKLQWQP